MYTIHVCYSASQILLSLSYHRMLFPSPDKGNEQDVGQKKLMAGPQQLKKIKLFNLASVVRPLAPEQQQRMSVEAFRRILSTESEE